MLTAANVVCRMIGHAEDVGFDAHEKFVRNVVAENVSLVATDEASHYRHLTKAGLPHDKTALCQISQRSPRGCRLDELWFPTTIMPRVQRNLGDSKMPTTRLWEPPRTADPDHPRPNNLGVHQTRRTVEDCNRPLLCHAPHSDLKHKTAIRC